MRAFVIIMLWLNVLCCIASPDPNAEPGEWSSFDENGSLHPAYDEGFIHIGALTDPEAEK